MANKKGNKQTSKEKELEKDLLREIKDIETFDREIYFTRLILDEEITREKLISYCKDLCRENKNARFYTRHPFFIAHFLWTHFNGNLRNGYMHFHPEATQWTVQQFRSKFEQVSRSDYHSGYYNQCLNYFTIKLNEKNIMPFINTKNHKKKHLISISKNAQHKSSAPLENFLYIFDKWNEIQNEEDYYTNDS